MLSETITNKIKEAAKKMEQKELYEYLINMENDNLLELNYNHIATCIDFALYLVELMQEQLSSGEWFGYELKALSALEDIDCCEEDLIKIGAYGYPQEIHNNDELLCVLGVADQMKI